jgi:CRISPR-associated protein Csd1
MILQALNNYYQRLKDDPAIDIPLIGFGRQKIHFCLVIDQEGKVVQVKDIRGRLGKKSVPVELTVPQIGKKRAAGIDPNFTWDNTSYVLGVDNKGKNNRTRECFEYFKKLHHEIGDQIKDEGLEALLKFVDTWKPEQIRELQHCVEMIGMNLVFQLDGDRGYIHDRPVVQKAWSQYNEMEGKDYTATCLVSGKIASIALLHPPIKGVKNAQTSGAGVVSFNLKAFESYGKTQNYNAPVSQTIAFS